MTPIEKTYGEWLRHPLWQQRRLQIMELAEFRCELCGDSETELQVHHIRYVRGRKPWEYPDRELRCLCKHCHEAQHPGKTTLTPIASIVRRIFDRVTVVDRYDPDLCVVCHASYRDDLTRCASCRTDAPRFAAGADAA